MSYTTLTPFNGAQITNLLQIGYIPGTQNISATAQRLGSDQPLFWVTGQKGAVVTVELRKMVITQALAITDEESLTFCQGRKVTITDQFARVFDLFCHKMNVTVRKGAGTQWLVEASAEVEAMPTVLTPPTTP